MTREKTSMQKRNNDCRIRDLSSFLRGGSFPLSVRIRIYPFSPCVGTATTTHEWHLYSPSRYFFFLPHSASASILSPPSADERRTGGDRNLLPFSLSPILLFGGGIVGRGGEGSLPPTLVLEGGWTTLLSFFFFFFLPPPTLFGRPLVRGGGGGGRGGGGGGGALLAPATEGRTDGRERKGGGGGETGGGGGRRRRTEDGGAFVGRPTKAANVLPSSLSLSLPPFFPSLLRPNRSGVVVVVVFLQLLFPPDLPTPEDQDQREEKREPCFQFPERGPTPPPYLTGEAKNKRKGERKKKYFPKRKSYYCDSRRNSRHALQRREERKVRRSDLIGGGGN